MSDNKILRKKIALIGAGSMIEEYIKVIKSLGKTELAGIYSRTKSKSDKLKKNIILTTYAIQLKTYISKQMLMQWL